MTEGTVPAAAEADVHVFMRCVPMQERVQEVLRALGNIEGQTCLSIGSDNGMLCHQLQRKGGTWHHVVEGERAAEAARALVDDERVKLLDRRSIPFKKKLFDAVVVVNNLERVESDDTFIEDCHRVLKPDGRLVVNVAHSRPWTVLAPLRKLLGLNHVSRGLLRPGYTESRLFSILKHGFDVVNMRSYSRLFVELVDTFVQAAVMRAGQVEHGEQRVKRAFSVASPFYRIAFQLDTLLFFTRGYALIATTRRRAWLPRNTPVLVDGRSISEAVLSRALE